MLAALLDPFEQSRRLAFAAGVVLALVGIAAGAVLGSLEITLFLAVGLGGSGYYLLHYRSLFGIIENDSFSRGFLRNFAAILPVTMLADDGWGLVRAVAFAIGIVSLFVLFGASFVVEYAPSEADDRGAGDGTAHPDRARTDRG